MVAFMTRDDRTVALKVALAKRRWTITEAAARVGCSTTWLRAVVRGDQPASTRVAAAITEHLPELRKLIRLSRRAAPSAARKQ
jgi:hypothetical protein